MPGDDYRKASHRIWEEMAAGWEGDRQTVWDDSRRPAWQRRADELGVSNAEFRTLDAERMDLDDASIDGVLCRWGYMLMADPAAALAETRRVLQGAVRDEVERRVKPYAEGHGYRLPGMRLNVLAA